MTLAHPRRSRGLLRAMAENARIWFALWPRRSPRPQAGCHEDGSPYYVDARALQERIGRRG